MQLHSLPAFMEILRGFNVQRRLELENGLHSRSIIFHHLGEQRLRAWLPLIPEGLRQSGTGLIELGKAQILCNALEGVNCTESRNVV